MIEAVANYLRGDGASLLGGECRSMPLSVMKSSGARALGGRVNFFVFLGDETQPRLVCHVPRHASGEDRLLAEWTARQHIQACLPATQRRAMPLALALERLQGTLTLIEEGLAGEALIGRLSARRHFGEHSHVKGALDSVISWLRTFQDATESERREWTIADEEEHVLRPFANLAGWLRRDRIEQLAAELGRRVRALRGAEVRWTAQHGDLWPGNILEQPGGTGLAVVDWEVVRLKGPAFADPLLFAFFYLFGERLDPDAADTALPPRWLFAAIRDFVQRTIGDLAVDAARLHAAFLLSLLARCQLARMGEGPPVELRALLHALRVPQSTGWLTDTQEDV
ncbi:MAG: phosphotransferase [Candidatus Binatia bacterium]